jgi:putative transcriptional regulator
MMDLTGKVLIAMPGMGDSRFDHSVIYLCSHGPEGAMGLIINKPAEDVRLSDLLEQLEIPPAGPARNLPVHFGGPVESGRGFVLHTPDYMSNLHTLKIENGLAMTATMDILEDIARGQGPAQALMMLGYSGWGPGQLENEIGHNGWLTADASADLVFETADSSKWAAALNILGVDPISLSASPGRA